MELAEKYGIAKKVQKLEYDLMGIRGVQAVEFDLNGFLDHMQEIIVLTKYHAEGQEFKRYLWHKHRIKAQITNWAEKNGLTLAGDRVEDYGEHFYWVFRCDESWDGEKQT